MREEYLGIIEKIIITQGLIDLIHGFMNHFLALGSSTDKLARRKEKKHRLGVAHPVY